MKENPFKFSQIEGPKLGKVIMFSITTAVIWVLIWIWNCGIHLWTWVRGVVCLLICSLSFMETDVSKYIFDPNRNDSKWFCQPRNKRNNFSIFNKSLKKYGLVKIIVLVMRQNPQSSVVKSAYRFLLTILFHRWRKIHTTSQRRREMVTKELIA